MLLEIIFCVAVLQLQTLDLCTGQVDLLPQQLSDQLPMANGATNWPGTDDSFVLLTQVGTEVVIYSVQRSRCDCTIMGLYLAQPLLQRALVNGSSIDCLMML